MIEVREYKKEEAHDVGLLCLKLWKESEMYNGLKVSPKVIKYLENVSENNNRCGVAAYEGNVPVGLLVGTLSEFWFGPELVASDVVFWVDEKYRDLNTATQIIRYFEQWAIDRGAVKINIGTSSGIKTEKTARLFKHFGYDHMGYMFCRRIT